MTIELRNREIMVISYNQSEIVLKIYLKPRKNKLSIMNINKVPELVKMLPGSITGLGPAKLENPAPGCILDFQGSLLS